MTRGEFPPRSEPARTSDGGRYLPIVAVYINRGHRPADGGRPFKHLDARCDLLLEVASQGYEVARVRNVDRARPPHERERRRCPVCFCEGGPLTGVPRPRWLDDARTLESTVQAVAWVYDLMWPPAMVSQVGMASKLYERLARRWRGTCQGRLDGTDSIPWYYDLLVQNPWVELTLVAIPYDSRDTALEAEVALREEKRRDGWQVSSDR